MEILKIKKELEKLTYNEVYYNSNKFKKLHQKLIELDFNNIDVNKIWFDSWNNNKNAHLGEVIYNHDIEYIINIIRALLDIELEEVEKNHKTWQIKACRKEAIEIFCQKNKLTYKEVKNGISWRKLCGI